ncbi:MAG: hypothetical protein IJS59_08805 [Bacteroidaceae bacterium]|nr:hypothetical protein [Bacteroidaceae bacterium]
MSWLATLFAAEAIPSAITTYVALLIFMQMGMGWGASTLMAAMLMLPWTARPLAETALARAGHLPLQLRTAEAALFAALVWLALSFTGPDGSVWHVAAALLAVAMLSAWHEIGSRHLYTRLLRRPMQRYFNLPKMVASQSVVVITYGVMIVGVGFLEVFYHNRRNAMTLSWSTAVYVLAGFYLLLTLYNLIALPAPARCHHRTTPLPAAGIAPHAALGGDKRRQAVLAWALMFAMLLPQALMFHARVLFFVAPRTQGGLGATLQWLGLAQGTVGVIAFSAGLVLGYWLIIHGSATHRRRSRATLDPATRRRITRRALVAATALLPLSPLIYCHLAALLPSTLLPLCVATGAAQFLFGFGLNACAPLIARLSGHAYDNATGYLHVPAIALAMLLPSALAGTVLELTSFRTFFAIDAACIPLAWAAGARALRGATTIC